MERKIILPICFLTALMLVGTAHGWPPLSNKALEEKSVKITHYIDVLFALSDLMANKQLSAELLSLDRRNKAVMESIKKSSERTETAFNKLEKMELELENIMTRMAGILKKRK
jgi:hypothetical protein